MRAALAVMDGLNARYGSNKGIMATLITERGWKLRAKHHWPCHTTQLADMPLVRA